jgi:hypothetical protein
MRRDRRWLFLLLLALAGGMFYALSPLLYLFAFIFRQGIHLIIALPQIVWWLIGGAILTFYGLHVFVRLQKSAFPKIPEPQFPPQSQGRLAERRRSLYEANSGAYSRDEVRRFLSTLAIDLISLKLDISEEAARKLYLRGDWTEDEILKTYFYKEKDTTALKKRKRLLRWFKEPEPSPFLKDTSQIMNRLTHYRKTGS